MHDYWRGGACEHPAIISFIGKNKTQWRVRAQEARRLKESGAPSEKNQLKNPARGKSACPACAGSSWCQAGNVTTSHTLLCSLQASPASLFHLSLSLTLLQRESSPPTHHTDNVKNARHKSQLRTDTNTNTARTLKDAAQGEFHRPTPHEGGLRVTPP